MYGKQLWRTWMETDLGWDGGSALKVNKRGPGDRRLARHLAAIRTEWSTMHNAQECDQASDDSSNNETVASECYVAPVHASTGKNSVF